MAQYNTNSFVWQALFLSVYRKNSTKNNRCGSLNKSPQGKEKVTNFSGVGVVLVPSLNQKVSKSHGDRHDIHDFQRRHFHSSENRPLCLMKWAFKKIWVFLLTRNKVLVLNLKTQEATLDLCLYLYKKWQTLKWFCRELFIEHKNIISEECF